MEAGDFVELKNKAIPRHQWNGKQLYLSEGYFDRIEFNDVQAKNH